MPMLKVREKLSAKVCRVKGGPVPAKLARVRAAQRLVGADFAAGCLERAEDTVLFLGSRKGCWVRTVANADTPALWLLDMIRRAASGLPQAAGTSWQKYGRAVPADALTAQTPAGQAGSRTAPTAAAAQTAQGAECPDFSAGSGTGRVCRCVVLHRRRPRPPCRRDCRALVPTACPTRGQS